ncbi:MAG: hypothetical protein CVV44_16935 [Spirochaetae bacterium HGW-Spirochaetae-1]|nr:MAG: hypothetical protein CVV44_16935 [Spirochaetae bacterium HGW-Spirochaetae-1]
MHTRYEKLKKYGKTRSGKEIVFKMKVNEKKTVLERSYDQLKSIYEEMALQPGTLRKIGLKRAWNVIIGSHGQCGLALNFTGMHAVYSEEQRIADQEKLRTLIGLSLFDAAARTISSASLQERSIGLACLNALSQPLRDNEILEKRGIAPVYKNIDSFIKKTDVVTVVGHGGVVRDFFGKCREIHVTDMRPKEDFQTTVIGETITYGPENIFLHGADENRDLLSRSDFVMITGSTLVNDTFDELMGWCANARVRALYGPSAYLAPEVLFSNGVTLVQQAGISNPERFEFDMVNDLDMESALKMNQMMKHEFLEKENPGK